MNKRRLLILIIIVVISLVIVGTIGLTYTRMRFNKGGGYTSPYSPYSQTR
jgi:flagellar basal body-associated protein FliL